MTFEAQETSIEDGAPVELFEFFVGGLFYRFVNAENEVTRSGQVYAPAAISRSNIKRSGPKFEAEVTISGSLTDEAIKPFLSQWGQISPEGKSTIRIYEKHLTDGANEFRTNFVGDLQSVRFDEFQAHIICKTIGDILTRQGPKDTWQSGCENQFGDEYCGVILASFQKTLPLTSLAADGITLTVATVGDGQTDGDYVGGYVKIQALPFDFRFIVAHAGDVITVQQPFAILAAPEPLEIVEGCPHTIAACDTRFSNHLNYGGTLYTPRDNPFTSSLDNL